MITACGSCISKLTTSNDRFCSEKSAIFECSVVGTGTTIWQGSAFNCTSRGIQLLHISNNIEGALEVCNNGAIKGRGLSILADNCFISQINITMSHTFNERTVQCVHDDGSSTREIGNYTLRLSSGCQNYFTKEGHGYLYVLCIAGNFKVFSYSYGLLIFCSSVIDTIFMDTHDHTNTHMYKLVWV